MDVLRNWTSLFSFHLLTETSRGGFNAVLFSILTRLNPTFLSISLTPALPPLPASNFSVQIQRNQKPSHFFIPQSRRPSIPCLTPPTVNPSLQSYKYGRIKVKIFSISVPYRRPKCHQYSIWALGKLGNEFCEQCRLIVGVGGWVSTLIQTWYLQI